MTSNIHFIEIDPEENCYYCGKAKLSENDKFYRVFVGEKALEIVVCELCKGGFTIRKIEDGKKSYATHFAFYVKRSFSELRNLIPNEIFEELQCCIDDFEAGNYKACLKVIGLVAEKLTNRLFTDKFRQSVENDKLTWETKLCKLLDAARKTRDNIEEAVIYQLFSLKLLMSNIDHFSEYNISAEDARLGLASITYLLQWSFKEK